MSSGSVLSNQRAVGHHRSFTANAKSRSVGNCSPRHSPTFKRKKALLHVMMPQPPGQGATTSSRSQAGAGGPPAQGANNHTQQLYTSTDQKRSVSAPTSPSVDGGTTAGSSSSSSTTKSYAPFGDKLLPRRRASSDTWKRQDQTTTSTTTTTTTTTSSPKPRRSQHESPRDKDKATAARERTTSHEHITVQVESPTQKGDLSSPRPPTTTVVLSRSNSPSHSPRHRHDRTSRAGVAVRRRGNQAATNSSHPSHPSSENTFSLSTSHNSHTHGGLPGHTTAKPRSGHTGSHSHHSTQKYELFDRNGEHRTQTIVDPVLHSPRERSATPDKTILKAPTPKKIQTTGDPLSMHSRHRRRPKSRKLSWADENPHHPLQLVIEVENHHHSVDHSRTAFQEKSCCTIQ